MYYVEQNNEIVLADNDFNRINATLNFMPQYAGLEVQETNKDIVEYKGKFYFTDDEEYISQKAQDDAERLAKLSLTKREVFLALYRNKGITPEQIKAQITNPEVLIEFEYATDYFRGNPLINQIGLMLGYSTEDLDYLFEHKELPTGEDNDN